MVVRGRREHDPVPESHRGRDLRDSRQHDLGRGAVRELLEEVVLGQPHVLEPHLLCEADLLDHLSEDLCLLARLPRPGNADLVEQAEVHPSSLARPSRTVARQSVGANRPIAGVHNDPCLQAPVTPTSRQTGPCPITRPSLSGRRSSETARGACRGAASGRHASDCTGQPEFGTQGNQCAGGPGRWGLRCARDDQSVLSPG